MSIAVYDLRCAPITFDFCNFVAIAHMFAIKSGAGFYDLIIRADSYRNQSPREKSYSLTEREWRLKNLILEVVKVASHCRNLLLHRDPDFPSVSGPLLPGYDPIKRVFVPYLLGHARSVFESTGVRPLVFRPSEAARIAVKSLFADSRPLVTLTLRRATFDQARNSRLDDWRDFARNLASSGIRLVVLPDQDDCLGARALFGLSFEVFEPAAFSLDLRLAVMELAQRNFISSGGMGAPAWYSEIPYVMFNLLHDGHYVANPDFFRHSAGLEVGENFAWALPSQQLEWGITDPFGLLEKYPVLT